MRILALALLVAAPVAAQTFTSPLGFENTEGNNAFAHWSGNRRFQQIDNSVSGQPRLIRSFAVRRNGGASQAATVGKTFDFTLDLGECNFGLISNDLDANFLPGTRKNVVPQTNVNFPDWSAAIPGPAPFDFVVPFPTPHIYPGRNALVIDFLIQNLSGTSGTSTDREFNNPAGGLTGVTGTLIGAGCTATGLTSSFTHAARFMNQGILPDPRFALRLRVEGANAPPSSPVLLFIDSKNQNIAGVACTTIHALPLLSLTVASDASGRIPSTYFGFPYSPFLESVTLFSQFLALDPGQAPFPVVLSNACSTTIPAAGSITSSHPTTYSWYTLPGSSTNSVFFGGGMVIQLGG